MGKHNYYQGRGIYHSSSGIVDSNCSDSPMIVVGGRNRVRSDFPLTATKAAFALSGKQLRSLLTSPYAPSSTITCTHICLVIL